MQVFEKEKTRLQKIYDDYQKFCTLLTYEEVLVDKKLFLNLQKQKNLIEPIALKYKQYLELDKNLNQIKVEIESLSGAEKELFLTELEDINQQLNKLSQETNLLLTNFNAIYSSIIVDINANKDELSQLLLENLVSAYKGFCLSRNLTCKVETKNKKASFEISGYNAEEFFMSQVGLHVTTNGGACQVFVCKANQLQVFDEQDVTFQTCRSSGAGGQHVNTTDSAIKATHTKTGLAAISQDERSQFQNKQKALERLKQKVEEFYTKAIQKEIENQKKEQLKNIKNNFIVRTYDFDSGKVLKQDKQVILLKDFIQGKDL